MNNYYIDIKDTDKYKITDKEYSDLTILYSQCFSSCPNKSEFIVPEYSSITRLLRNSFWNLRSKESVYLLLFMLKEKADDKIVGFFKIAYSNEYYEIYDVCKFNPEKKTKVVNLMCKFMKKCLVLFFEKISKEDKKIILSIDKKNKYYERAKKLYKKVGFKKTYPIIMSLLRNDWINHRYYVFVN